MSVAAQACDEGSVLSYARRLHAFRRESGIGAGRIVSAEAEGDVLRVRIECEGGGIEVDVNFGAETTDAGDGGGALFASLEGGDGLPGRSVRVRRAAGEVRRAAE